MFNKTIKLTLTKEDEKLGLAFESDGISTEEITAALSLCICAVANNSGIDPVAYSELISDVVKISTDTPGISMGILNLIEEGTQENG
jgi:hypothetical protein